MKKYEKSKISIKLLVALVSIFLCLPLISMDQPSRSVHQQGSESATQPTLEMAQPGVVPPQAAPPAEVPADVPNANTLVFSPDGSYVAVADCDSDSVTVYPVTNGVLGQGIASRLRSKDAHRPFVFGYSSSFLERK
jgi:hypothetical protein